MLLNEYTPTSISSRGSLAFSPVAVAGAIPEHLARTHVSRSYTLTPRPTESPTSSLTSMTASIAVDPVPPPTHKPSPI